MISRRRMLGLGSSVVAAVPAIVLAGASGAAAAGGGSGFPTFPVAPGYRVNVRNGPGTNYAIVRVLPAGATVGIRCQCDGMSITGPYGTTTIWDNIANGEFISDAYVKTGSDGYITSRCG